MLKAQLGTRRACMASDWISRMHHAYFYQARLCWRLGSGQQASSSPHRLRHHLALLLLLDAHGASMVCFTSITCMSPGPVPRLPTADAELMAISKPKNIWFTASMPADVQPPPQRTVHPADSLHSSPACG